MIVLGNERLLNSDLAVILNSSQSKSACGNDPWVRDTSRGVAQLISRGHSLVTSVGLNTWELCIHLVAISGGCQVIIYPVSKPVDYEAVFAELLSDFELDEKKTAIMFDVRDALGRSHKDLWPKRDEDAIEMAGTIAPVSIRPRGRLSILLERKDIRCKVTDEFSIEYSKPLVTPPRYNPKAFAFAPHNRNALTHWTKSCHGPWPGEKAASYYHRLLNSGDSFPGNAFSTLENIARERRIRASADKIRGGKSVVGLTEAPPQEALALMRWRARQVNWNFEPYGVVISQSMAREFGLRSVIYGHDKEYKALSEAEKPFFQSLGKAGVDWSREKEWRKIGDLDLSLIPGRHLKYVVPSKSEELKLRDTTDCDIISLCEE